MNAIRARPRFRMRPTRCPYCHDPARGSTVACVACSALHHRECWGLHGGCSACGLEASTAPPQREWLVWRRLAFVAGAVCASVALLTAFVALFAAWCAAPLAIDGRLALAGLFTFVGVTTSVGCSFREATRGSRD